MVVRTAEKMYFCKLQTVLKRLGIFDYARCGTHNLFELSRVTLRDIALDREDYRKKYKLYG